jgi:hypothetical protein
MRAQRDDPIVHSRAAQQGQPARVIALGIANRVSISCLISYIVLESAAATGARRSCARESREPHMADASHPRPLSARTAPRNVATMRTARSLTATPWCVR